MGFLPTASPPLQRFVLRLPSGAELLLAAQGRLFSLTPRGIPNIILHISFFVVFFVLKKREGAKTK